LSGGGPENRKSAGGGFENTQCIPPSSMLRAWEGAPGGGKVSGSAEVIKIQATRSKQRRTNSNSHPRRRGYYTQDVDLNYVPSAFKIGHAPRREKRLLHCAKPPRGAATDLLNPPTLAVPGKDFNITPREVKSSLRKPFGLFYYPSRKNRSRRVTSVNTGALSMENEY